MRQSKIKALELEQAEAERRLNRKNGFSLMDIRDRGWVRLTNGSLMEWHVDRPLDEGEARTSVPAGMFKLDGKPFDNDNFMRFHRWV